MKRILSVILCVFMFMSMAAYAEATGEVKETEYELWTQSPAITCGITNDEVMIYKALYKEHFKLMPLERLGSNYYLAICEDRMSDGGYNGKDNTLYYDLYVIYQTEDGIIILSHGETKNEYYWGSNFCIMDLSDEIDSSYYQSINAEVPYYVLNPTSKYVHSYMAEYDEFIFITDAGRIYVVSEYINGVSDGYLYIKDKKFQRGQNRYYKGSSTYPYYYMPDGVTEAASTNEVIFRDGSVSYGDAILMPRTDMTAANGYKYYNEGFTSNLKIPVFTKIPGSNDLYFEYQKVYTLNNEDDKKYYYLNVDIYKLTDKRMVKQSSTTVPTKVTSSNVAFSHKAINGIDEAYYTSKGLPVPAVAIGTYGVITKDGKVFALELDTAIYSTHCYPCTYNGHFAVIRSYNGDRTIYMKKDANEGYKYWQSINEIVFYPDGTKTMSEDIELTIESTPHEGQNGYFTHYNTFQTSNFTEISTVSVKEWWGIPYDNVFPDGRYVTVNWVGMGNSMYQIWYNIYNADGTLRATGPTGYSSAFSSILETYKLIVWTINDSKFIVTLEKLSNDFLKEYYRAAVVEETDTGEVVSKVELGEKNITPPVSSDTEVVQSKIDFASSDLPLGYNIKDNVIDSGKLDVILREQVNSIRLNDIVILAHDEYQSGEQNTGVTLNSYATYDYTFGDSYVRLYTNGQYFRWYCNNPENLIPGTYSKVIEIGDKTIYVTFRVVQPPTNEGSTTVVF